VPPPASASSPSPKPGRPTAPTANNNGLKTGYKALDDTILPGLLPGQVVIVLAKTGSGKTVFLCNLAYNMRAHQQLCSPWR
jgi:replicative DNA helicase